MSFQIFVSIACLDLVFFTVAAKANPTQTKKSLQTFEKMSSKWDTSVFD